MLVPAGRNSLEFVFILSVNYKTRSSLQGDEKEGETLEEQETVLNSISGVAVLSRQCRHPTWDLGSQLDACPLPKASQHCYWKIEIEY